MKYCPECGTKVIGEPRYCEQCGATLGAPSQPAATAPAPTAAPPVAPVAASPASSLPPIAVYAPPKRRRTLIIAAAVCVVVAALAGGWFLWSSRPPSKSDIPNVVAMLGLDEQGVEKALTAAGATRVPGTRTGGEMQTLLFAKFAKQVSFELPRLNTWSRRPNAAAGRAAWDESIALTGVKLPPTTTDAKVVAFFDASGKCVEVDMDISGLAARTALGSGVQLADVARAAGLPSDAQASDLADWEKTEQSNSGATFYRAQFALAGSDLSLSGSWSPRLAADLNADGTMKYLDASTDAGDVRLQFGATALVGGTANPFADTGSSSPSPTSPTAETSAYFTAAESSSLRTELSVGLGIGVYTSKDVEDAALWKKLQKSKGTFDVLMATGSDGSPQFGDYAVGVAEVAALPKEKYLFIWWYNADNNWVSGNPIPLAEAVSMGASGVVSHESPTEVPEALVSAVLEAASSGAGS